MKWTTLTFFSVFLSFGVFANETVKKTNQKISKTKLIESKNKVKAPEAPCADSKEDLLKKLEAEKKAKEEAGKGFSLQGSKDTGCSIK